MIYSHTIDNWSPLEPAAGEIRNGVTAAARAVAAQLAEGGLPPLNIAAENDDLVAAQTAAEMIKARADHVLVLGIGGSSLGAQALAQIAGYYTSLHGVKAFEPRVHFLESPDGPSLAELLETLPLERTHTLIVSKSGGTAESMMQALAVFAKLKADGLGLKIRELASVITEPKANPLNKLAAEHSLPSLPHPTDIGGRYSVLSVVGLLPALLMGLDPAAIRGGAKSVVDAFLADPSTHPATEGARFAEAAAQTGRRIQVLMPYSDRLERFAMWYRQIWAESIGKDGKGSLPVRAMGPVDQHSQLQLYLDGPDDYAITVLTENLTGKGPVVPSDVTGVAELDYLKGHAIGDLVMAEASATLKTVTARGRPARLMEIETISEETIGGLMAHFMLETIITAELTGVNAFDQPAVEEGKVLARQYLADRQG